ncbi:hypothetical protein SAMN04488028_101306 [Reichenbachiella agariperforans]|uniref:MBG domain-containing protein n=1 Tax=Reichenbachiella agariperforans TaxID=156994 RepID=A0A1M6JSI2_REIAG|nr:hypothetical protein [Reichenbachiella agariperforans]SHJ49697.1 hypothetical protein SAMN04488028_101306 [Reichenbachiella agariperforans]
MTVTDANSNNNTSTATVTISEKEQQNVTFTGIADKVFGDSNFNIVASVDSGLALDYAVTGPATLSGNVVTIDG